jgi:alanine racemase
MTVRLTVDERAWSTHVQRVAAAEPTLIPVVKGNGYGFGRSALMPHATEMSAEIAVGTVYEAHDVPGGTVAVVLTPAFSVPPDLPAGTILTVGSIAHVDALRRAGWRGRVVAKVASSMRRYGAVPPETSTTAPTAGRATAETDLPTLLVACADAGLDVVAAGIHLPLAGDDAGRVAEVSAWLPHLPGGLPLWVSHLGGDALGAVRAAAGDRAVRLRTGTGLWHGDKSMLHLEADVLDVRPVTAGTTAGYRATPVPADGWLVLAGAGSAHGVAALDGGRSPFHHARRRTALLEPPHMHTSMLLVRTGDGPPPAPGDWLDLQRPLVSTTVDEVRWV